MTALGAIVLVAVLGGCGGDEPSEELVRLDVVGALEFGEDAEAPGSFSLNEHWVIDRGGSGVRTSDDPAFDDEFTVPDEKLQDLASDLDALDFEYLDERYGAEGGDATTTTLSYDEESLRVGDLFSKVNSGDDEQADRLFDVAEEINRLGREPASG